MTEKIYAKIHEGKYGLMIAACDEDVCGKTLKDPKKKIEFFVNPRFYKEEEIDKGELKVLLGKAVDANLVGKNAVSCGVEVGFIKEDHVLKIQKVPHAIYSMIAG